MSALRNEFEKQGFVIRNNLVAGEAFARLNHMCDQLLDGKLRPDLPYNGSLPEDFYTFWEPGMKERADIPRRLRVRLMSYMSYYHSWFWDFAQSPEICDVMRELFDDDVQIFSDTVFMKPPRHGIEAAPHQDTAFWPKLDPKAVLFWMALDPATVANGCLHVIPGSHRTDIQHHPDPLQKWILREDQADFTKQVPIELRPGSAIFMDSGLIHRSYANKSDNSRRAMTSVYVSRNVRHVEPWTSEYTFKPIPQSPRVGTPLLTTV